MLPANWRRPVSIHEVQEAVNELLFASEQTYGKKASVRDLGIMSDEDIQRMELTQRASYVAEVVRARAARRETNDRRRA